MNDHIVGPHGDVLVELQCSDVDGCYELARKECGGDFDVVQSMASNRSGVEMIIKCSA